MPILRNISVEIHTQYGDPPLPEYLIPLAHSSPHSKNSESDEESTASAYALFQPGAQFWIVYSVLPPHHPVPKYFFVKLTANGKQIASWGFGADCEYKGKAMFALFEPGKDVDERRRLEKLVLAFSDRTGRVDDALEIKFFRSSGRKQAKREVSGFGKEDLERAYRGGLDLIRGGQLHKRHPKDYYKYALEDPTDRPYATFKYFFRTHAQLRSLGLETGCNFAAEEESRAKDKVARLSIESSQGNIDNEIMSTLSHHAIMAVEEENRRGKPGGDSEDGRSSAGLMRRLSIPPSRIFLPPLRFSAPDSPRKTSAIEDVPFARGGESRAVEDADALAEVDAKMVEDRLQDYYSESPTKKSVSTKIRGVFANAIRRSFDG